MTDAQLDNILTATAPLAAMHHIGMTCFAVIERLTVEIRRLNRGDFTPEEFQSLCHHRDEKAGCTRADFETGCAEYQRKLFGEPIASKEMTDAELESALAFLQSRVKVATGGTFCGTFGGLNRLPFMFYDAIAKVMCEYADSRPTPCDNAPAMAALEERVRTNTPHPSHVWSNDCCIRCEAFRGFPDALLACDPSKLVGKMEACCECGEDYPRSDLIAGHIFCPLCRKGGAVGAPD